MNKLKTMTKTWHRKLKEESIPNGNVLLATEKDKSEVEPIRKDYFYGMIDITSDGYIIIYGSSTVKGGGCVRRTSGKVEYTGQDFNQK